MSNTISVRNASGQVASFSLDDEKSVERERVLRQRINRGELEEVALGADSVARRAVVVEIDANVRDENGNLLKSIHAGGLDPDAAGDSNGVPSGSGLSAAQARKDAQVAADAVALQVENAGQAGVVSATAVAAADPGTKKATGKA